MKTRLLGFMLLLTFVALSAAAYAADAPPAVEVHGWVQLREYINTTVTLDRDPTTGVITDEEEESHLDWERISFSGLARLPEGKLAYGEVYIHPWLPNSDPSFLYLESLYLDVPAQPGGKFRIGKGRNCSFGITPSYGNRKTSNYSPLQEAFTMDRVLGVQYLNTHGNDSINLGIFNGQRPGTRYIGMAADSQLDYGGANLGNTTVAHLSNRDTPADRPGTLQASARVGRQIKDLNVGLSGQIGQLDDTDAAFLASKFGDAYPGLKTASQYGLDATYKKMPWIAQLEAYAGDTGGIERSGWSILVGIEPSAQCTSPWREWSGACKGLFVRYTDLNIDVSADDLTAAQQLNPITWDTQQWAVSYVYPLRVSGYKVSPKWLQFEYERNTEDAPAGASEIPNNVFFIELFVAF